MEECFLSDAEIQARYPGVTAETTTSKAGTETIWRLEGRYVGQSINGKGMTALCPVS